LSDNIDTTNIEMINEDSTVAKTRRWPWIVGIVGALLIGLTIGLAGGVTPVESSSGATYESLDGWEAALAEQDAELAEREAGVEQDLKDVEQGLKDVTAGEAELEESQLSIQADLQSLADELDERKAALDERETALAEREAAVGKAEETKAANTIAGDGIWTVGEEIKPGTYKAQGSGSTCYWARLSGLSGGLGDIIANYLGSAKTTVEIHKSDAAFETTGCGEWVRQ
jgi:hypothetical protein